MLRFNDAFEKIEFFVRSNHVLSIYFLI